MNDYWNDPPEYPEPPECCGDIMDVEEKTGACVCPKCGKRIEPQPDPDPRAFADVELPDDITAEECLLGGGGAEHGGENGESKSGACSPTKVLSDSHENLSTK